MKDSDIRQLNDFDPNSGMYLVMSGRGEDRHIVARELKALKIPFLGRILKKIGYPALRFRKVVDYLFTEGNSLQGIHEDKKELLRNKIIHYFNLDEKTHAHRHLKQWGKVCESFDQVFSTEQVTRQETAHPQREITYLTDWGTQEAYICELPDEILQQLPANETYIVTTTSEDGRPINTFRIFVEHELAPHVKSLDKRPIILVVSFGIFSGSDFKNSLKSIEALKTKNEIRDYCPIYRAGTNGWGPSKWSETKDQNEASIQALIERLEASL